MKGLICTVLFLFCGFAFSATFDNDVGIDCGIEKMEMVASQDIVIDQAININTENVLIVCDTWTISQTAIVQTEIETEIDNLFRRTDHEMLFVCSLDLLKPKSIDRETISFSSGGNPGRTNEKF